MSTSNRQIDRTNRLFCSIFSRQCDAFCFTQPIFLSVYVRLTTIWMTGRMDGILWPICMECDISWMHVPPGINTLWYTSYIPSRQKWANCHFPPNRFSTHTHTHSNTGTIALVKSFSFMFAPLQVKPVLVPGKYYPPVAVAVIVNCNPSTFFAVSSIFALEIVSFAIYGCLCIYFQFVLRLQV